ncbi:4-hydroxy-tetrahydrodipicolinate synthase [Clostridium sp. JNZ X4-2]
MYSGIFTPMITVLDENRDIDFKGNGELIDYLVGGGVNGILILGSTGEFFSIPLDKKKKFISFVIEKVNKRVPVLVGTGGTDVDEVVELTKFCEKEGADAVVVVCPYYFKLGEDSLYKYYSEIAENTDIPIIMYNFPDRTCVNMSAELILKLALKYKNIVGIKDTVDNMSHTRKIIQVVKLQLKDFMVFSGFEEYFIPNLLSGGNGLIGGLSNFDPELFSEIFSAYNKEDFKRVKVLQNKINKFMGLYDIAQPFIPTIKTAVSLIKKDIKPVSCKPLGTLNEVQAAKLKEILKNEIDF